MKQIIRLTESDLHRLVKESVRRILAETDASAAGELNTTIFPMVSRPSIVGEPIDKKIDKLEDDAYDRDGGKNHSLAVNEISLKNALAKVAVPGIMAMSPIQGNAQIQDGHISREDSINNVILQRNKKTYTKKELIQICPQAYVDRNATPDVWKKHASEGKYYASVNDNGDGKYKDNLVAYVAGKNGKNPWDALVKRFCRTEDDDVFQMNFDI